MQIMLPSIPARARVNGETMFVVTTSICCSSEMRPGALPCFDCHAYAQSCCEVEEIVYCFDRALACVCMAVYIWLAVRWSRSTTPEKEWQVLLKGQEGDHDLIALHWRPYFTVASRSKYRLKCEELLSCTRLIFTGTITLRTYRKLTFLKTF